MKRKDGRRRVLAGLAATALPLSACDAQDRGRSGDRNAGADAGAGTSGGASGAARPEADGTDLGGVARADLDAAAKLWIPWTEPTAGGKNPLLVAAGSALDLSAIATAPTSSRLGKRGLGFNLMGFRLPTNAEIPDYVNAVKRNGHAYIRFFALDPWFARGSTTHPPGDPYGCTYEPKLVEQWWRYLAALSDANIQYSVEFLFLASAMMARRNPWPDKPDPASQSMVLKATLNEPNAINHWKHCFEVLCNRVNPYFSKPRKIAEDSNCLFIGSANENNLWNRGLYYLGQGAADVAAVIQPFFDAWQSSRGGTRYSVPAPGSGSGSENTAYGQFLLDTHAASYKAMRTHAQAAGFAGKMSAVNYVPGLFDGVLRAETLDMVDCHMYFDLDDHGGGGANRSIIGDKFYNANWLASGFVYGKRAAMSEYAVGGPSPWGYEFPYAYALAALQDLDWIAQFARMDNSLDPLDPAVWTNWFDKHVHVGQDATKDVVSAAASRIGAFLFNRGDVTRSATVLGFVIRRAKTLAHNPPWHTHWPHAISNLALLCGVRAVNEADVDSSLKWQGAGTGPTRIYDPFNDSGIWKKSLANWITDLKSAGLLSNDNTSNDNVGIYESDNKQLRMNSSKRTARVLTPRSHLIIWDDDAAVDHTPFLMLDGSTDKGLISIHDVSPTPSPLTATTRALLIHLSEVRGSKSDGSGPYDFAAAGAEKWGPAAYSRVPLYAISGPKGTGWRKESHMPARIRGSKSVIRLALPAGDVVVHRLDVRGKRIGTIPVQRMPDATVRMMLDNTSSADLMQTVYYEVTVKAS